MSGIVGIVNLDGAPVERKLLEHLTKSMTNRGPDAQDVWIDGSVGFGHTLLATTNESKHEHQPCSLDGQVWITADARIDGRSDLIAKLGEQLRLDNVTDVELILRAYQVWGEGCVQHLIGDFAFAIWDGRRQRLFCARDQLGVKLFYYARVGNSLIFSNTLNCIRLHPQVSNRLNEQAIADFLLFDMNYNLETTTFADIGCLLAAHTLTLSDGEVRCQRYWTLPVPEMIRYKRDQDYVDRFKELMGMAVSDRLRTEKVAVLFSGGLDSTTIAATALEVARQQSQPLDLQAFTAVYDRLIPDTERYYAGIAAKALKIPLKYLVADEYKLYEGWEKPDLHSPEPINDPLSILGFHHWRQIASHSRVVLDGQGGDEALRGSMVVEMFRGMFFGEVMVDVGRCVLKHHLRPPMGLGIAPWLQRVRGREPHPPSYPNWIEREFAENLNLSARWDVIMNTKSEVIHHYRPKAYEHLMAPIWSSALASLDSGVSQVPVEVRLPFLDLRLLDYALALPPLPWCVRKHLLRVAMRGILPDEILQRPKTPLAGDPVLMQISQGQKPWHNLTNMPELEKYVNVETLLQEAGKKLEVRSIWESLRPVSLGYWLQSSKGNV